MKSNYSLSREMPVLTVGAGNGGIPVALIRVRGLVVRMRISRGRKLQMCS